MAIYDPNSNQHSDGSDSEVSITKKRKLDRKKLLGLSVILLEDDREVSRGKITGVYMGTVNHFPTIGIHINKGTGLLMDISCRKLLIDTDNYE
jgi:hypothetical protein